MILASLADILLDDVTLTTKIDDRVYAQRRPNKTTLPCVLLRKQSGRPLDQISGFPDCDETTVQLDVLATDTSGGYFKLGEVGDRCRTLLEGYKGEVGDHFIHGVSMVSDIETQEFPPESSDHWIRKRSLTFRVTATNNVARI